MGRPAVIEPFVFYERPAGSPPLITGQSGCVEDHPAPSRLRLREERWPLLLLTACRQLCLERASPSHLRAIYEPSTLPLRTLRLVFSTKIGSHSLSVILFIPLREFAEPFSQRDLGRKAKVALQGGAVGIGHGHVAGLHGHQLLVGVKVVVGREHAGAQEFFLQGLHKVKQALGLAAANVVHGIRGDGQSIGPGLALGGALHHAYYSLNDVIHIRKVAAAVAVVVDLDGLSAEQLVGEPKVGHVGPSGGAIDGEEPQAGAGDVVELAVAVGHELVALLGGGIQGDGVVHAVVGAKGHLLVAAIHATAAGINQVLDALVIGIRGRAGNDVIRMPTGLQYVIEPDDVAFNIHIRILNAIAHAGLRSEVDHYVKLIFLK